MANARQTNPVHPEELKVTHIDLLRHGQCEGGAIFRGHFDAPLTAAGFAHMQAVHAASGAEWDRIISSPLQRCWRFAETLAPLATVAADARLKEMSFGDWDGMNIAEIWRDDAVRIAAWSRDPAAFTPPGGEPLVEVDQRVASLLADLVGAHAGQKVLLITHGGVIRVLLTRLLGMPLAHANRWEVPYGCFSRVAVYHHQNEQRCQLVAHNFVTVAP